MRGLLPAIKHIVTKSKSSYTSPLWTLTQITGDLNHRVYHCQAVQDEQRDLMVKIFEHTDEQLAWREYSALRALWSVDPHLLAPAPLLLLESYISHELDVLITEWLDVRDISIGETLNKILWTTILNTLAEMHQITPQTARVKLSDSIMAFDQPIDFINKLQLDFSTLQDEITDHDLLNFVSRVLAHLEHTLPHKWADEPPKTLIHGDWHIHNFAMDDEDEAVRFFDWEMAGWGDPALDIALLLTHESFAEVSQYDQRWLVETYQEIQHDATFVQRVDIYSQLLDVEWLIDTARRLHMSPSDELIQRLEIYQQRLTNRYPVMDT